MRGRAAQDRRSAGVLEPAEELRMLARAVAAVADGDSLAVLMEHFPARIVRAARELVHRRAFGR